MWGVRLPYEVARAVPAFSPLSKKKSAKEKKTEGQAALAVKRPPHSIYGYNIMGRV